MDRKILRKHGRNPALLPEFAPLPSSPARQDWRTQRRFRPRARPETASSWYRNSLSAHRTDWQPDQAHSGSSIDQSEALLRTPQLSRVLRMFRSNEIHLDNDAARWLPRFCIRLQLPRDTTASTLYR